MKLITCPQCGEDTEIRNMLARTFSTPGPKLTEQDGWTLGAVCTCGNYVAYGHLEGGQFVIERETL